MQVIEATTRLGVIQTANPEDSTLPPKLLSHLAHSRKISVPGN